MSNETQNFLNCLLCRPFHVGRFGVAGDAVMKTFEVFRKGQIIPKRIGKMRTNLNKAQHCLVFGTNVVFCDGAFYADPICGEAILILNTKKLGRKRNNGTFQKARFYANNIYLIAPKRTEGSGFSVKL